LLCVEHVTQKYGGFCALDDVSFTLPDEHILGLIGPNGAGKTTLLNTITGFQQPTLGQILLNGCRIDKMQYDCIARMGVGRTFQNLRLFRDMTVREHIMVAQNQKLSLSEKLFPDRMRERRLEEKMTDILRIFGIEQYMDSVAQELSYGDCRRVEIVRALAGEPSVLLLDEPCAGLNEEESAEMAAQILGVRRRFKISIMLIEHDMSIIRQCCDNVVVLNYGRKIAEGSFDEIARHENVQSAYLGEEDA